ncbi:tetratricopeptide repeat protein [bacterium]|nr:tetratricopeptide repeat protein [bacterium]
MAGTTRAAGRRPARAPASPARGPAPRSRRPPRRGVDWRTLAGAALIAVVSFVIYAPALRGPFVFDDILLVSDNPLLKLADGPYRFWFTTQAVDYWPVTNTCFWIEWRLWGADPTGYHLTGLLLHIAIALLVWRVLAVLAVPGAFLAALLFTAHPVNVETIAWIAQRKSQLAALFALLATLAFLHAERPPPLSGASRPVWNRWYWLALGSGALAMLSKISAAVLPPALLLIVWWKRPLTRRDLARVAPLFALVAALLAVNLWFRSRGIAMGPAPSSAGPLERVLGAAGVVWFYLGKAVLPRDLALMYPDWHVDAAAIGWWLALAGAVLVTAVLWWYRQRGTRSLLFAWLFFGGTLFPVMGFTDVGVGQHIVVADHYQHLALIAVVAVVAAALAGWRSRLPTARQWLPPAVGIAVAGVLAVLAWQQSALYGDGVTLYEDTLRKNPDAWAAHNNLGSLLFDAGRLAEAEAHFRRALDLNPNYAEAHDNLANVLQRTERNADAIAHYQRALAIRPAYPLAHNNLAVALIGTGDLDGAIEHFQRALALKPDYQSARDNLALAQALKQAAESGQPAPVPGAVP